MRFYSEGQCCSFLLPFEGGGAYSRLHVKVSAISLKQRIGALEKEIDERDKIVASHEAESARLSEFGPTGPGSAEKFRDVEVC